MKEENLENKKGYDIAEIFNAIDDAIPLVDIIAELADLGYSEPGKIVVNAMQENILYVESIDYVDGSIAVYMALTVPGEKLWKSVHATS